MGRRLSGISDVSDAAPAEHSQQFREFLASELAALQERLVAKFEQGEPARASRASRREYNYHRQPSKETCGSLERCSRSDEEVLQTLPAWDRMVAQLLAAAEPTQYGLADLVVRLSSRRAETPDNGEPSLDTIIPHTVWISQDVQRTNNLNKTNRSRFALSLVSVSSQRTDTEGVRREAGGVSRWIVIHPDSVFRYLWCLFGTVFLMYDLFAVPMEAVGLWPSGSFHDFIMVGIAYWSADIIIQSVTGYHTQSHIEMRPFKVFIAYASTWMPLDLVVLLIDVAVLVFTFNATARSFRILKLFRIIRIARLHKLVLVLKSIMKNNTSVLVDLSVKIGRLMFVLVSHCHFTACAWYGVAEAFEDSERRPGERNWVEASGVSSESQFMRYAVALHWSITQFTPATNDVVPVNGAERVFAIAIVLIGFVTFSAFLSSMMGMLSQLKSIKQSKERERMMLLQFFRAKGIPADLADRVLRSFDAECKLQRDLIVEDDLTTFSCLPLSLRLRIRWEYCFPVLKANIILGGVHILDRRCFLQVVHEAMTDQRCMAQQEVFLDGIESHHMYAVLSGKFKYYQSGALALAGLKVNSGWWVSEACLYVQWIHQGSLVAKSCSEMMQLDCQVFQQIVMQTGGDLFRVLSCCALLFAHKLEESLESHETLSDLGLPHDEQNEILGKALRLCQVHCTHDPESDEDSRALTPLVTLRKSIRRSLKMMHDPESDDEDEGVLKAWGPGSRRSSSNSDPPPPPRPPRGPSEPRAD